MKVARECQNCGGEFFAEHWFVKNGGGKFCGLSCYRQFSKGRKRGVYSNTVVETRECPACGQTFKIGGVGNRARNAVYCSAECKQATHTKPGKIANRLCDADAGYLAGFIDGEGSITLVKRPSGAVTLRIFATNNHKLTLEWLREITGVGSVTPHHSGNEKHAASWYWNCAADAAETLLRQIRPYMHVKAEHADVVLELRDGLKDPAKRADKAWQAQYFERLRHLNKRGPKQ